MNRSDFPRERYFALIDFYCTTVKAISVDGVEPELRIVVAMLAATVDSEGALLTHVDGLRQPISDGEEWLKMCTAAGWTILQRYKLDVEKGVWP